MTRKMARRRVPFVGFATIPSIRPRATTPPSARRKFPAPALREARSSPQPRLMAGGGQKLDGLAGLFGRVKSHHQHAFFPFAHLEDLKVEHVEVRLRERREDAEQGSGLVLHV